MAELGWEPGQKFTIKLQDDGSIILEPYAKLEIELDEYSREDLISLIEESCDKDISVNEVIVERVKRYLGQEMA